MNALTSAIRRKRPIAFLGATLVIALVAITVSLGTANAEESARTAASTPKGNQDPACSGIKAFSSYQFLINGNNAGGTFLNKLKQGDKLSLMFRLKPNCDNMYVGLSSFTTPPPPNQLKYSQQKHVATQAKIFPYNNGGLHGLSLMVPECYFQMDAYNQGTFAPGDFTGGGGKGFIAGDVGGSDANCATPTTAPATTQPIDKVQVATVCAEDAFRVTSLLTENYTYVWHVNGVEYAKQKATTTGNVVKTFKFADVNVPFNSTAVVKVINVEKNQTIGEESVKNNCVEDNTATATKVCEPTEGFRISIQNNAPSARDFRVKVNGNEVGYYSLSGGASTLKNFNFSSLGVNYNQLAIINVTDVRANKTILSTTIKNDCSQPTTTTTAAPTTTTTTTAAPTTTTTAAPTTTTTQAPATVAPQVRNPSANVVKVCKADGSGINVTLTNGGNVQESFTVRNGQTMVETVTVNAGASVTRSYTFEQLGLAAGANTTITVVANSQNIANLTVTNDCVAPAADVAASCPVSDGNAVFTFTNNGQVPQTFTVVRDGKLVAFENGSTSLDVAPKSTETRVLVLAEDESATLTINSQPGNFSVTKTVEKDCVEVQGVVVTPTTQAPEVLGVTLARTGITGVGPMSALGLLLLGAGVAALRGRKRLS